LKNPHCRESLRYNLPSLLEYTALLGSNRSAEGWPEVQGNRETASRLPSWTGGPKRQIPGGLDKIVTIYSPENRSCMLQP